MIRFAISATPFWCGSLRKRSTGLRVSDGKFLATHSHPNTSGSSDESDNSSSVVQDQGKHPRLLCGTEVQRRSIALDTLRVMQKDLKFNICDLPISHLRNIDIDDLDERK
ncbi:hypothetical protein B0H13DRAFT_2303986 [Mycena leptocephala]|nr:hypothetical protein B0H13DRAFT_2303986 [Mycena leptocephala]